MQSIADKKPDPSRIFLRLKHGLGDNIQFRIVVAHIRAAYPEAFIRIESPAGCQCIYSDLVNESEEVTYPFKPWGWDIAKYISYAPPSKACNYCPSTKPTTCLVEEFGLEPEPELFRYGLTVTEQEREAAQAWADKQGQPIVLIHYEGTSQTERKNLPHDLVEQCCERIREAGCLPVILDWSGANPLVEAGEVCPSELWGERANVGQIAALIETAVLLVGIDSGPGHIAGATSTPTLLVWTTNHPVNFYDLADNVLHFVSAGSEAALEPYEAEYFATAYDYRPYADLKELPYLIRELLTEE